MKLKWALFFKWELVNNQRKEGWKSCMFMLGVIILEECDFIKIFSYTVKIIKENNR